MFLVSESIIASACSATASALAPDWLTKSTPAAVHAAASAVS